MQVIGLDVGTTSTIGILLDTVTGERRVASRPATLRSPHPGWAEEDPKEWWRNCASILGELSGGADVAAVGVAGMVPATVLLDRAGRLLRPSIQQSDGRVAAQVAELAAEVDAEKFLSRTGNGVNQQLVATKLRWLERHEPVVFAAIGTVFGSYDYVNLRLTGARRIEQNWALEGGFVDLADGRVAADLVALARLSPDQLPPLAASLEVVGAVTAGAAAATGLRPGTPVVAGCADHVASAFVAGIAREGDLLLKFGGAGDILLAADRPVPDARLFLDHHLVSGKFLPNGCMAASGAVLNWIVATMAAHLPPATAHAELDALADAVPPGSEGLLLLPYFLGEKTPINDPLARGALVGLGLHHTLGHIWRAALEAVAFGFRHHIDVFHELGLPVRRVVASDGGARSAVWMQIAADVLGRPVQLLRGHPGSCLGAAYLAAVANGGLPDWEQIGRFVRPGATVLPDPGRARAYDAAYLRYRGLYPALALHFHGIDAA